MPNLRLALLASVTGFGALSKAQQSGWTTGQVNATMCSWEAPRAAVIRDTVYIDGGDLWWLPGMNDGSYGPLADDGNPLGLVYTLNFSTSFNTSQNVTAIMGTMCKAPNCGPANNFAPNYIDGAMLGNDDEWFLYGGLQQETGAYSPPPGNEVIAYEGYQYGVEKSSFRPGFLYGDLPTGMTTYITYGGAASAPSENKAWYFSGMRSQSWGPIYQVGVNNSLNPTNLSDTLITLDMSTQQQEKWTNVTLPSGVGSRAGSSLVWVPVGAQGILVALGGVVFPEWANVTAKSSNAAASEQESPGFMSTVDVYDIAGGTWYQQPTTGGPGALGRGCAVVAPAQDYSSFSIYYYGGFNGIDVEGSFSDDVWILSLPSFMWMKVYSGNSTHARAGHQCVKPYPDQMMVIGGYTTESGGSLSCIEGGVIQLFNLSSVSWMTSYNSSVWSEYEVPSMIYVMIGGTGTGGATMTTPTPTGWATPGLASVFATPYPTSKITTYYPYGTSVSNSTLPPYTTTSGSSVPKYLPPLLGVIFGLMLVTAIAAAIIIWRRRRLLRNGAASESGTDENGNRILSWMRGQQSETKAPTVTTEDTPVSPEMDFGVPVPPPVVHHEMADTQVAELMDTSPRAELQDTGLTPVDIITKHSHFAQNGGSLNNPSYYSGVTQTDHASTVSRYSDPRQAQVQYAQGQAQPVAFSSPDVRSESPPLDGGRGVSAGAPQVVSGVSGISERDKAHLRQVSDGSVSSVGGSDRGQVSPGLAAMAQLGHSNGYSPTTPPVSPPSAESREGEDYLSARRQGAGSPLRRSVFREDRNDMDGEH